MFSCSEKTKAVNNSDQGGIPAGPQEEDVEDQGFKVYHNRLDDDREHVIYISNPDRSGERELAVGYRPALSPDRTHMVYVRRSDLYPLDLETKEETLLLDSSTISENFGVGASGRHPDGTTVFFDSVSGFWIDLYAIKNGGTYLRLIIDQGNLAHAWPSPFSPDGPNFLFNDCFDDCSTLLLFDPDTATDTRTYLSRFTDYGAWSPGGRHIAFGGGGAEGWGWGGSRLGLFVATVYDGQVRQVLEEEDFGALSWSSDSMQIAFSQRREDSDWLEGYAIYEVALDGTGLKERTTHFDKWEYALPSRVVEERT